MDSLQTLIQQAADDHDVQFRSYSGRAMYGKECIAITGETREINRVIAAVSALILDEVFDAAIDSEGGGAQPAAHDIRDKAHTYFDKLHNTRSDSMGFDTVLYWPDLEPEATEHIEDFNEWMRTVANKLKVSTSQLEKLAGEAGTTLKEIHEDEWDFTEIRTNLIG